MPRPRLRRRIRFSPDVTLYKPQGVPRNTLEIVDLSHEEVEALRLKHVENHSQTEAAKEMETSQSSFQRILESAHKKMTDAIIYGKGIQINSDNTQTL